VIESARAARQAVRCSNPVNGGRQQPHQFQQIETDTGDILRARPCRRGR
jgi:hypothetical protein